MSKQESMVLDIFDDETGKLLTRTYVLIIIIDNRMGDERMEKENYINQIVEKMNKIENIKLLSYLNRLIENIIKAE